MPASLRLSFRLFVFFIAVCIMAVPSPALALNTYLDKPEILNLPVTGQIGGVFQAVTVQGFYMFSGEGSRLHVFDLHNPDSPTLVGSTEPLPFSIGDITVAGDWVFAIGDEYESTLLVIDVTDRTRPRLVSTLELPEKSSRLVNNGSFVFITTEKGVRIVSVVEPLSPRLAGFFPTPSRARGIAFSSTKIYVDTNDGTIYALNIIDAPKPTEIAHSEGAKNPTGRLMVYNGVLYQTHLGGINMYDPINMGNFKNSISFNTVLDIQFRGNVALVSCHNQGIFVIDISNPYSNSETVSIASMSVSGFVRAAVWAGSKIIVANEASLIQVTYAAPSYLAYDKTLLTGGYGYSFDTESNILITSRLDRLVAIDITDPKHPVETGELSISGTAMTVDIDNQYVYATDQDGLHIGEITETKSLNQVFFLQNPTNGSPKIRGAWANGDRLYILQFDGSLVEYDITIRSAPIRRGSTTGLSYYNASMDMQFYGEYSYYVSSSNDVAIIDLRETGVPKNIGTVEAQNAYDLHVYGGRLFVADPQAEKVLIYDLSNPASPTLVGSWNSFARKVSAADNILVVDSVDLCLVNITDPSAPETILCSPVKYARNDMAWHNGEILVLESMASGLLTFTPEYVRERVFTPLLSR